KKAIKKRKKVIRKSKEKKSVQNEKHSKLSRPNIKIIRLDMLILHNFVFLQEIIRHYGIIEIHILYFILRKHANKKHQNFSSSS
ncbi:MAG: hypothetical protein ACPG3Z_05810, partial [Saprospiraceae bacterium]